MGTLIKDLGMKEIPTYPTEICMLSQIAGGITSTMKFLILSKTYGRTTIS